MSMSQSIADALGEAEKWADQDPAYAELMATLADLAELLDLGLEQDGFVALCREHMAKTVVLDQLLQDEFEERWALWCSRNMNIEGGWL